MINVYVFEVTEKKTGRRRFSKVKARDHYGAMLQIQNRFDSKDYIINDEPIEAVEAK